MAPVARPLAARPVVQATSSRAHHVICMANSKVMQAEVRGGRLGCSLPAASWERASLQSRDAKLSYRPFFDASASRPRSGWARVGFSRLARSSGCPSSGSTRRLTMSVSIGVGRAVLARGAARVGVRPLLDRGRPLARPGDAGDAPHTMNSFLGSLSNGWDHRRASAAAPRARRWRCGRASPSMRPCAASAGR